MGRNSYTANRELKLCTGPLHRSGAWLPVSHFQELSPSSHSGTHRAQCNPCWRQMKGYPDPYFSRLVPVEEFQPCIDYLRAKLGSKKKICAALGYADRAALSYYGLHQRRNMRGTKFQKILELVEKVEKSDPEIMHAGWQSSYPVVVDGKRLAEIVQVWIDDFNKRYDLRKSSEVPVNGAYGPTQFISMRSGLSTRRIWELKSGRQAYVSARQADKVLTAIDHEDVLDSPELPVFKNPTWPMRRYLDRLRKDGVLPA